MIGSTESFNPELNKLQFTSMNKGLNPNDQEKKNWWKF